jgi:hypothetical protein
MAGGVTTMGKQKVSAIGYKIGMAGLLLSALQLLAVVAVGIYGGEPPPRWMAFGFVPTMGMLIAGVAMFVCGD